MLDPEVETLLKAYHTELLKFNAKLNLISVKTTPSADVIHFADSLLACHVVLEKHNNINEIYDIGSGNGFPGLVLAILAPHIKVNLVDADMRKTEFLKHVVHSLGLSSQVNILNTQVEKLPANSIDFGICRGFANLSKAILACRNQFKVGATFFHLKGDEWAKELAEVPGQLCSYWTPGLLSEYKLPLVNVNFAVVKTEKIKA
jgi:16S rRNA (guanine527-N7)-methyltransferase